MKPPPAQAATKRPASAGELGVNTSKLATNSGAFWGLLAALRPGISRHGVPCYCFFLRGQV